MSMNPRRKTKKEKTKAEVHAELDVQDALLAIRLREFLKAQGVCEGDLRVEVDGEGAADPCAAKKVDGELHEVEAEEKKEEEEENILDEYFMGIEEEEHDG